MFCYKPFSLVLISTFILFGFFFFLFTCKFVSSEYPECHCLVVNMVNTRTSFLTRRDPFLLMKLLQVLSLLRLQASQDVVGMSRMQFPDDGASNIVTFPPEPTITGKHCSVQDL